MYIVIGIKLIVGCIYPKFDEILEANRDVLEQIKEKEVDHGHN